MSRIILKVLRKVRNFIVLTIVLAVSFYTISVYFFPSSKHFKPLNTPGIDKLAVPKSIYFRGMIARCWDNLYHKIIINGCSLQ